MRSPSGAGSDGATAEGGTTTAPRLIQTVLMPWHFRAAMPATQEMVKAGALPALWVEQHEW